LGLHAASDPVFRPGPHVLPDVDRLLGCERLLPAALPKIRMWERRCPCGLNAYGMTLPDPFRVWRAKAAST
jgi:hypothetical protein